MKKTTKPTAQQVRRWAKYPTKLSYILTKGTPRERQAILFTIDTYVNVIRERQEGPRS
jgi:hypothetical protein